MASDKLTQPPLYLVSHREAPHGSAACAAAAPTAAPRRGAPSEADYPAQPAGHPAPDEALGGGGGPRRHRAPRSGSAETGLRLY